MLYEDLRLSQLLPPGVMCPPGPACKRLLLNEAAKIRSCSTYQHHKSRMKFARRADSLYLAQVYMHGKSQTQWNDRRFYVALRQVKAFGEPISPPQLENFKHYMHSLPCLRLPEGGSLPANVLLSQQRCVDAACRLESSPPDPCIDPLAIPHGDASEAAVQLPASGKKGHGQEPMQGHVAGQSFQGFTLFMGRQLVSVAKQ